MASQTPDPKTYYGYLFKADREPTETLDALLRAVAQYIISEIDDKTQNELTPKKMAAYFHAVGGNYDRLFNMENEALSYIFSTIGCQHTLQPVPEDDFRPPCIPALTTRGFVRWQSVELLLSPSINVPFLQFAVENWHLKHPDTGEPFPSPLPAEAFPTEPDKEIKRWWEEKLELFKKHDPSTEEGPEPEPEPEPERERRPNVKTKSPSSSGSRSSPRRARAVHVSSSDDSAESEPIRGRPRGAGGVNYVFAERPAARHHPDSFISPTFKDDHIPQRRRSLSLRTSPTRHRSPEVVRQRPLRRKVSPKVVPVIIPSDESPSPTMRSRATYSSDPALHKLPMRSSVRHVPPGHGSPHRGSPHHGSPHHGSPRRGYSPGLRPPVDSRHDDRRKSFPFEGVTDKLMNRVSNILSRTPERRRSSSRTNLHGSNNYSRGDDYGHCPDRHSPDTDNSDADSSERGRRRRQREWERDRDRDRFRAEPRGKERYDRDRERDRERDRDALRARGDGLRERERERERERDLIYDDRPLRPAPRRGSPFRRMASHSDADRRHPPDEWMEFEAERGAPRPGPPRRRREGHPYRDGRD